MDFALTSDLFRTAYDVFANPGPEWANIPHNDAPVFAWNPGSMYLRRPPFLDGDSFAGGPITSCAQKTFSEWRLHNDRARSRLT